MMLSIKLSKSIHKGINKGTPNSRKSAIDARKTVKEWRWISDEGRDKGNPKFSVYPEKNLRFMRIAVK
jgi:hypothetical protein